MSARHDELADEGQPRAPAENVVAGPLDPFEDREIERRQERREQVTSDERGENSKPTEVVKIESVRRLSADEAAALKGKK